MHHLPRHRHHAIAAAACLAVGAWPSAWAQTAPAAAEKAPVIVEAQEVRARPDLDAVAEGDAKLRQGPLEIRADRLSYDQATDTARAFGNVRISRDGNVYSGPELQLKLGTYEGYFVNPTYFFSRTQAGGSASRLDFMGKDVALATDGNYTSCPRDGSGEPAWLLQTRRVRMDLANNEGIAEGAVLRFYGVPILAAPVLSFPLTDARKSGWLPPTTSVDNKSGLQLSVPYYWNIAPNRDATLTPTVFAKRGVALGTQFRYLERSDEGSLTFFTLPNDRLTGHSRDSLGYLHEGNFLGNGFYKADVTRVSDNEYWKDFPGDYPSLLPRLLTGDAQVQAPVFGNWKTYARVLRWQILQDKVNPIEAPYDRYPQVGLRGTQRLPGGFEFGMETEFNRFTNPNDITSDDRIKTDRIPGDRWHTVGSLSLPLVTPSWSLVPKFSFNAASYHLDKPLTQGEFNGRRQFSRTIPTFSLDSAWVLERDATWFGRDMHQTLEPRLYYVKTPYRDQKGLPKFDTAARDFNFDSIYSDNGFSGVDRVSDYHQVTAGVTTRMLDAQTGAEALRVGIAQRFLLSDQRVTTDLDETKVNTQSVSDLLLMGSTSFWPQWTLDAGVQYSPEFSRTTRSLLSARYSPGPYRTLYTAYRFKRDESEQAELGWQWPVYGQVRSGKRSTEGQQQCSGAWYSVGRVNYSLRERRVTDSVLGFEYDAGCWIGRVVAKRVSTSRQDATTQLGFEIEFVGLSRLGTNPLKVLKDNIPGYRLLRDDAPTEASSPTAP
ncbi:LPS-assembly protein LptD [Piscinibacter gummiphilus]|uniref:LPS-assembly protein LptD n=1 Tax=Piscinibacter gummiphilus TaxID=946333 RepID=A0ABZ0CSR9_9BURK|nr:LPS assembly protein LptD [Piscinibacter gummiphilus]WOB08032.1 LPS assembly protein LptD [Piscinibacter gummiphilus]